MKIGSISIVPYSKIQYNNTPHSERMIEVPLLRWFLNRYYPGDIIEVGAVSPYYLPTIKHKIYDPMDPYEKCIREDACNLFYGGAFLLSISTVEHIGRGDYGQPEEEKKAIQAVQNMLRAKRYLITWAANQNPILDNWAEDTTEHIIRLKRIKYREWEKADSLKGTRYDHPFPFGNGLYIVTNCPDLLEDRWITDKDIIRGTFEDKERVSWLLNKLYPQDLSIIKAFYGPRDVTDLLQSYVDGDSLSLSVNNISLGGDPAPNTKKTLRIAYQLRGRWGIEVFPEGEDAVL